ncbi:MAG: hypothetical protein ACSHYF_05840 [Verrucomicrobiaceae bacterium]
MAFSVGLVALVYYGGNLRNEGDGAPQSGDKGREVPQVVVNQKVSENSKIGGSHERIGSPKNSVRQWSVKEIGGFDVVACEEGIAEALENLEGDEERRVLGRLFKRLGEISPAAAIARLELIPYGETRQRVLESTFWGIVKNGEIKGLEMVEVLEMDEEKKRARAIVVDQLYRRSSREVANLINEIGRADVSIRLAVINALGVSAGREGLSWNEFKDKLQVIDPEDQHLASDKWISSRVSENIGKLVEEIDAGNIPSEVIEPKLPEVALTYAQQKPRSASEWLSTFPDSDSRNLAIKASVGMWLAQNTEEAGIWVNDLPEGSAKDYSRLALVGYLAKEKDFEFAKEWASAIRDEEVKRRAQAELEIYSGN